MGLKGSVTLVSGEVVEQLCRKGCPKDLVKVNYIQTTWCRCPVQTLWRNMESLVRLDLLHSKTWTCACSFDAPCNRSRQLEREEAKEELKFEHSLVAETFGFNH